MNDYTKPPIYHMPDTGQLVVTVVFGVAAAALLGYAVYLSRRHRSWLPILFWIGGGLTVFLEPIGDVMGNAVHSQIGQWNVFTVKGAPIPWYVIFVYPTYFGALPIFLFEPLRNQTIAKSTWWKIAVAVAVGVATIEQVPVGFGIWHYYGHSGLKLVNMPLSMIFTNIGCVLLPGLMLYTVFPALQGWRQLLVLGILPSFGIAGHAGSGWVMYNILGTDTAHDSQFLLQLSWIGCAVMAYVVVWTALEVVYGRPAATRKVAAAPATEARAETRAVHPSDTVGAAR